jgi:hypothetical protein
MAVGVLVMLPGVTKKTYESVNEKIWGRSKMDASKTPEGLIIHSAGPAQDGWYIYDIWDSKEDFERFGQEKVRPAVQQVTGSEMAGPPPQFFEIADLVKPA